MKSELRKYEIGEVNKNYQQVTGNEESLKRIDNRSEETEMFENMEELEKARIKSKKVTYDWNIINADNSIAEVNNKIKEKL